MFNLSFLRSLFGFGPATPAPGGAGAPAPGTPQPAPPIPVVPMPAAAKSTAESALPRGVRNCNPGNIDRDGTVWLGMAADQSGDDRFIIFKSAEFGIRALVRVLISYQDSDHCTTADEMIDRWAPPGENDTAAYKAAVTGRMGIAGAQPFDIRDWTLCALMTEAIIAHENANYAYPIATVNAGLSLAGIVKPLPDV